MSPLLSVSNAWIVRNLASSSVLVAFDFDGVLAAIVDDRNSAAMRPTTSALLRRVCDAYPVAIISGRSMSDLVARLDGSRVKYVLANHGVEPGVGLDELEREVQNVLPHLEVALHAGNQGVEIEDKRYSITVHYRRARNRGLARRSIERAVGALPHRMKVLPGELAISVLPQQAPRRGDLLTKLCLAEQTKTVLFVGNGVTDEDVFPPHLPLRFLGIPIGESANSEADYFLRDQSEIDQLLDLLWVSRPQGSPVSA